MLANDFSINELYYKDLKILNWEMWESWWFRILFKLQINIILTNTSVKAYVCLSDRTMLS